MLNPDALVSVQDVRDYMLGRIADAADARVVRLINAFSKAVRNYCQREFVPAPGTGATPPVTADNTQQPLARKYRYDGSGFLALAPYELRTLGGAGYGGQGQVVFGTDLPTGS